MLMLIVWAKHNCYEEKKKDALLDISNVGPEVNSGNKKTVHVLSPECKTQSSYNLRIFPNSHLKLKSHSRTCLIIRIVVIFPFYKILLELSN
jgi:hypothetical protein